jgi:hypothetical protein
MARYTIGRSRDNDIVLTDTTVSRQHAMVEDLGGGRFVLRDVGSSRGTLVHRSGGWEEVTETEVTADEPVVLGEMETTVGKLLAEAGIAGAAATAGVEASMSPAAASAPAGPKGGGLSPGAKWALIGGGVFLVVAMVTAVVLVLVLGDGKGGGFAGLGGGGSTSSSGGAGSGGTGGGSDGGATAGAPPFQKACEERMNRNPRSKPFASKLCGCIVAEVRKSSEIGAEDRQRILEIRDMAKPPRDLSAGSRQAFGKIFATCLRQAVGQPR